MCSTEPVPGKSSIFNLGEKAAIISEMSGGIDKIKNFLLKMKEEKSTLGSGKELVGSETCEKIMEFLDENKFLDEGYRYFLLEAAELYEMEADSHKEFEKLTLRDIEEINNTVKDVEYFMETGILNDSILEKIGTYEKSIEPYEDCCTVFLPKHPSTKPRLERILASESKLDCEKLIEEAVAAEEIIEIRPA